MLIESLELEGLDNTELRNSKYRSSLATSTEEKEIKMSSGSDAI